MTEQKLTMADIILGGLYYADPATITGAHRPSREQSNWLFLACRAQDDGTIWMIDTYHLEERMFSEHVKKSRGRFGNDIERTNDFIEGVAISEAELSRSQLDACRWHCYYNSCTELSPSNAGQFSFLGVLSDYECMSKRDSLNYADEDRIPGAKLWHEHNYPDGAFLVRKGAVQSSIHTFNSLLDDFHCAISAPGSPVFDFAKLEAAAEACPAHSAAEFEIARRENEMIREMSEKWRSFRLLAKKYVSTRDESLLEAYDAGVPVEDILA